MDKKYAAKKAALKKLKGMMGGPDLEGGISARVIAKDPESLKEGLKKAAEVADQYEDLHEKDEYSNLSREELIRKLKERS